MVHWPKSGRRSLGPGAFHALAMAGEASIPTSVACRNQGSYEPLKSLAPMVNAEMSGEAPPCAQARQRERREPLSIARSRPMIAGCERFCVSVWMVHRAPARSPNPVGTFLSRRAGPVEGTGSRQGPGGQLASAAYASAEGVRQPMIAGASWISASLSRAATMNRAKSTRRVMLLARMGSPTCRSTREGPGFRPLRVRCRARRSTVSLANTRRQASTWSSRSTARTSLPNPPGHNLPFEPPRVDVPTVAGDVPATGEHQPRARCRQVQHRLRRPVE